MDKRDALKHAKDDAERSKLRYTHSIRKAELTLEQAEKQLNRNVELYRARC